MFFPGSTIGNFTPEGAVDVLQRMAGLCQNDGVAPIGVDLKKDHAILEPAYDDAERVSRESALNYLIRLNRELGADFELKQFGYTDTPSEMMPLEALRRLADWKERFGP